MSALALSSGELEATFLPERGMLGTSLRHRGDELLSARGLPLLHPWANRLGSRRYTVAGVEVDLTGLDLHTDPNGLPLHGTMADRPGWEVVDRSEATVTARFDYGLPDLLAAFPFPHVVMVDIAVEGPSLAVATSLEAAGDRPVPISFGYHPWLALGPAGRDGAHLGLPARAHLLLDDLGLPTGERVPEAAEDAVLGERSFDDLYALGDDRRLSLSCGGRRLVLDFEEGYPCAQVFAPSGSDFACLEPMTAPTNALVTGGCPLVPPGERFTARFTLTAAEPA